MNVAVGTLIEALDQFRGPIMAGAVHVPALKTTGARSTNMPVKGSRSRWEARPITIFEPLLGLRGGRGEAEVHCSNWYLYPPLVDDPGKWLGCGAHVTQLRRTQVASCPYERMLTLSSLSIFEQAKAESIPPRSS